MSKRVVNALTLLSAVACVLSAMLVGRSWFRTDHVGAFIARGRLTAVTIDAQLLIVWDPLAAPPQAAFSPTVDSYDAAQLRPALDAVWGRMRGIRPLAGWNVTGAIDERVILPLWPLPLLTAIAPVRWWRRRRREAGRGFPVAAA